LTFARTQIDGRGNVSDPDIARSLRTSLEALAAAIGAR